MGYFYFSLLMCFVCGCSGELFDALKLGAF